MKTDCTTLRNTINQSVHVCTRLGETVMGHLPGSQYQTQPGEAVARRLPAVGCRLSSHTLTKQRLVMLPGTDGCRDRL